MLLIKFPVTIVSPVQHAAVTATLCTCQPGERAQEGQPQPALPLCKCNTVLDHGHSLLPPLGLEPEKVGNLPDQVSTLPACDAGAGRLQLGSRHCPRPLCTSHTLVFLMPLHELSNRT